MHTYWLTFRLADKGKFSERHGRLMVLIKQCAERSVWQEPTSFLLFRSELDIDALANHLKQAIDPSEDVLLIAMLEFKAARLIGVPKDHSIYAFLPHIQDI